MQHPDPESLSLLALGEELGDDAADHLSSCDRCAEEYAGLRRAVVAVKPAQHEAALQAPGPQVWAGIHSALGLSPAAAADPVGTLTAVGARVAPPPPSSEALLPLSGAPAPLRLPGGRGWFRGPGVWLAAAASSALLAAGVFWLVQQNQAAVTPLAQAQLKPVDQHSATGSARVVESRDGQRTLEVRVDRNEARGYQEVWLIAPDLSRLVSLGVLTSESGSFSVPAGLDLGEFPIVDVSDEPADGNPAHSSVSIVRGTLAS